MKPEIVLKQYEFVRLNTVKLLGGVSEEAAVITPEGFANNILWNAGHLLVTNELMMYGREAEFTHFPQQYKSLFAGGTKPVNWPAEVPTLAEVIRLLNEQQKWIVAEFADRLEEKMPKPFITGSGMHNEFYGEMLAFSLYHEGMHNGMINSLKKLTK